MLIKLDCQRRLKAAGYHLLMSATIAAVVASLVFFVWYPYPLWKISGGMGLFGLVVACDIVLGPLFTLVVFNPQKSRRELTFDLFIVAVIQLAALGYGISAVWAARPIYLVFERDLFRVIRITDIPEALMPNMPEQFKNMPIFGPKYISLRRFSGLGEQLAATTAELGGLPLSAQPKFWIDYTPATLNAGKSGKLVSSFIEHFPAISKEVETILTEKGLSQDEVVIYPLVDKSNYWTIFVRKSDGIPVGYLPVDPYW